MAKGKERWVQKGAMLDRERLERFEALRKNAQSQLQLRQEKIEKAKTIGLKQPR